MNKYKEAIQALKYNYPQSEHEQLVKAMDLSIEVLSEYEQKLEEIRIIKKIVKILCDKLDENEK